MATAELHSSQEVFVINGRSTMALVASWSLKLLRATTVALEEEQSAQVQLRKHDRRLGYLLIVDP
jgi:hypothetical protein